MNPIYSTLSQIQSSCRGDNPDSIFLACTTPERYLKLHFLGINKSYQIFTQTDQVATTLRFLKKNCPIHVCFVT